MEWVVNSSDCRFNISASIEASDKHELKELLQEELSDQLWDAISDIATEYRYEYRTTLSLDDVETGLLSYIKEQIECKYSDVMIQCTPDNPEKMDVSLSLSELSLSYLELCWDGTDTVYPKVGCSIEKALAEYTDRSVWNVALCNDSGDILYDIESWPGPTKEDGIIKWNVGSHTYYPVIWYGPRNEVPISKWIIWDGTKTISAMKQEPIPFLWSLSDTWDVVQKLVDDSNDAFLIWYTAECGFSAPNVDEIRETCPVRFLEGDSYEVAYKKVSEYFFSRYLKSRYHEIEITACVYSEKANASIGFGVTFDPEEVSVENIGTDWIWEGMADSFWENAYEFEDGVMRAQELCEDEDDSFSEALLQVFGPFSISFECNASEVEMNFEIDASEISDAMYEMIPDIC